MPVGPCGPQDRDWTGLDAERNRTRRIRRLDCCTKEIVRRRDHDRGWSTIRRGLGNQRQLRIGSTLKESRIVPHLAAAITRWHRRGRLRAVLVTTGGRNRLGTHGLSFLPGQQNRCQPQQQKHREDLGAAFHHQRLLYARVIAGLNHCRFKKKRVHRLK
jgi:hypothetical protein